MLLNLKAFFDQSEHVLAKFTTWMVLKSAYISVLYFASTLE